MTLPTGSSGLPVQRQPLPSGSGQFDPVVHDAPASALVFGAELGMDASLTASITDGAPWFKLSTLQACNISWVRESSDPNPGGGGQPISRIVFDEYWVLTATATTDGTQPLTVTSGQWIGLTVSLDIPRDSSLPPGPFQGAAVIHGKGYTQKIALAGTYLAVDPNSPIGQKWQLLGGEKRLGTVLTLPTTAPDGQGTIQTFENGVLYQIAGTSTVYFMGKGVYAKWLSLETAKDALGNPVWGVLGVPAGDTFGTVEGGHAERFQGGVIVIRKSGAAWVVYGGIYAHYTQFGDLLDPANQPWIGLPTADEGPVDPISPNDGLRVSTFDAGNIYWSHDTGAHEMHGLILQHWLDAGGFRPGFGLPTTDETTTVDGAGRFNSYAQGGLIVWRDSTGAWALQGPILDRWNSLGGVNSYLGYPKSDIVPWSGPLGQTGVICTFEHGQIILTDGGTVIEAPSVLTLTASGTSSADFGHLAYSGTITIQSSGDYTITFHAEDDAFNGYDFQLTMTLTAPGGIWLGAAHSGSLAGSSSTGGSKTDDHSESGRHAWINLYWVELVVGAKLTVSINASANGLAGFFDNQLTALVQALATTAVAGPGAGAMVLLGAEVSQVNLGIGGALGVLSGVAAFVLTGAIMLALPFGIAVGAVTAANIKKRPISSDEYDFANNVFRGTLPPMNQIILTSMSSMGGRAFTVPGIDGNIYMNLGACYDSPMTWNGNTAYPRPGEVFIHEMTHVWQIKHASFVPGLCCDGIVNQAKYTLGVPVYNYGPPSTPWGSYNLEAQGAIVDQWFGGVKHMPDTPSRVRTDGEDPSSPDFAGGDTDPYFPFIRDNIRAGRT